MDEQTEIKPQIVTEEVGPETPPIQPDQSVPRVAFLGSSQLQPEAPANRKNIFWAILLVILLIVAGGLVYVTWFANQSLDRNSLITPLPETSPQPTTLPDPSVDEMTADLENFESSDELEYIEKDLTDTNLDSLDRELEIIETELEQ